VDLGTHTADPGSARMRRSSMPTVNSSSPEMTLVNVRCRAGVSRNDLLEKCEFAEGFVCGHQDVPQHTAIPVRRGAAGLPEYHFRGPTRATSSFPCHHTSPMP
jgi:hypothetical protein